MHHTSFDRLYVITLLTINLCFFVHTTQEVVLPDASFGEEYYDTSDIDNQLCDEDYDDVHDDELDLESDNSLDFDQDDAQLLIETTATITTKPLELINQEFEEQDFQEDTDIMVTQPTAADDLVDKPKGLMNVIEWLVAGVIAACGKGS